MLDSFSPEIIISYVACLKTQKQNKIGPGTH